MESESMELARSERAILERYRAKCVAAGGPKVGYVLRRKAIGEGVPEGLDGGLDGLVGKGLLAANEEGTLFFLTDAGVEAIGEL